MKNQLPGGVPKALHVVVHSRQYRAPRAANNVIRGFLMLGSARSRPHRLGRAAPLLSILTAVALGLGLAGGPAANGAPDAAPTNVEVINTDAAQVVAPVPDLAWRPCQEYPGIQCSLAQVPLDYDEPNGKTTNLRLLRVPAINPSKRLGTVFVNPGGPGGEARGFAAIVTNLLPPNVSRSFDVVGIDPRGVDLKAPAVCKADNRPDYPRVAFPLTKGEANRAIKFSRWVTKACRKGPAPIVDHLSTADVARDMDLIRQAQGDEQLNYVGISYGTYLGATYAAMFPDRVRTMVLDGVLDPVGWATGTGKEASQPFSRRIGSGEGSWKALKAAFKACDKAGPSKCAAAGDSKRKWKQIERSLKAKPLRIVMREEGSKYTFVLRYQDVISLAGAALYDARGVEFLMDFIDLLHAFVLDPSILDQPNGRPAAASSGELKRNYDVLSSRLERLSAQGGFGGTFDPFSAIACADTDNPSNVRDWVKQSRQADTSAPGFGPLWTWASSPCAGWSEKAREDRYAGPFDIATATPALIIANTNDPATPIKGARAMADDWAGSRLLKLDMWGHGSIASSDCVDDAYAAYLLRGELPPVGTVCKPKHKIFK